MKVQYNKSFASALHKPFRFVTGVKNQSLQIPQRTQNVLPSIVSFGMIAISRLVTLRQEAFPARLVKRVVLAVPK